MTITHALDNEDFGSDAEVGRFHRRSMHRYVWTVLNKLYDVTHHEAA